MKEIHKNLFFTVVAIVFFFATNNIYAQDGIPLDTAYDSAVGTANLGQNADEDEYNSARSNAVTTTTAINNALLWLDPSISDNYEEIVNSQKISPDMKRGVLGLAEDGVMALYENQPTVNVYAHLAEEWIPGYQTNQSVYAQDTATSGYKTLEDTGIASLWSISRNIAYIFFILIMIIVGFMIMFRSKLGGQTLVTLGNSLPNVIIALIGVTFSFAIAGLLIDLGGLIMVILDDLFITEQIGYEETVKLGSIGNIFKAFLPGGLSDLISFNGGESGVAKKGLFGIFGGAGLGASIAGLIFSSSAIAGGIATVGLPLLLITLAAFGVAAVGVFKVFITLTKAYIGILFNVITGPIQIAFSAIPGKNAGFINWAKSILRNVLVYPIVFAILNLPAAIYAISGGNLTIPGPQKLTLSDDMVTISGDKNILTSGNVLNSLLLLVLQIMVLFIASKADQYAKTIIPPSTSKEAGNAAQEAKRALSGIPVVGSLLGK
jgi:hypothetical protein